jgi:magnesium transporter
MPTVEAERCAALEGILEHAPGDAAAELVEHPDDLAAELLSTMNPARALEILDCVPIERRQQILAAAPAETRRQWVQNDKYPEQSIGRLMEPAIAVFRPDTTVAAATEQLRQLVTRAFITYLWVSDATERLVGVVAMREMLLGSESQTLAEIMIAKPFHLTPEMSLTEAMKESLTRHYPAYPVCDRAGKLVGIVRGQTIFEAQAFELSAQAGSMVGVEKEERLATPWMSSFKFRHPWLQLNLLTAFLAAAVVGFFEHTIERIVILAVFLPVLAGQSGNTGCQALAVTLRGMTLGELTPGKGFRLVGKEAFVGAMNGAFVGISAGLGMLVYAHLQHEPRAILLAFIVFLAMTLSCVISGISGALVPMILKKLGADPATASSIFLTTSTDVVSMGTFLGLATLLIR